MSVPLRALVALCLAWCLLGMGPARAEPAQVVVGAYVNKIEELNFRENKYVIDFYIWFRWKAEGELAEYKPLESFEIINGRRDAMAAVVEKKIGDLNYAIARITATINEKWDLKRFPFDSHHTQVRVEDSVFTAEDVVFVADEKNSRLGDEIEMSGWTAKNFVNEVERKIYRTNYGDTSLATDAQSTYSRYVFGWDIERTNLGAAIKLLSTVLLATAVSFVAFMVRPSDLDARYGMGVGSLFAVMASAVIVSSSVPDSGGMTLADQLHMVALAVIFVTLLLSSLCLRLETHEQEELAYRIDHWCLAILPLLFYGWAIWAMWRAARGA